MIRKKILFVTLTLLVSIVGIAIILEIGLRFGYAVKNKFSPRVLTISEDLGWRPTANLIKNYSKPDYGEIHFTSLEEGFRRFGDPSSEKTKILVVGDSFTQAYHVSDQKAYFDYLDLAEDSDGPQFEVFSFAAGGYGTLQQLMSINLYFERIQPDIVIWQFCGNDFINNSWELESKSFENSSHMRRPYWENGNIVFKHPAGGLGWWSEKSYLIRKFVVLKSSFDKRRKPTIEKTITQNSPLLVDSLNATKAILTEAIARYPGVTFYSFFAGSEYFGWEIDAYMKTCTVEGMRCLPEIHQQTLKALRDGVKVQGSKDGHWTEIGHQIAGTALRDRLKRDVLLRLD